MEERLIIHASQNMAFYDDIELRVAKDLRPGRFVAQPVQFISHTPGELVMPFMRLQRDGAQMLMDELWRVGVRPTEGNGSAGSMAAVQAHLADMRRLVFEGVP